jgi:hypothetical protein
MILEIWILLWIERGLPSESFIAVRQVAAPAIIVLVHWTLNVLLNLFTTTCFY